MLADDTPLFSTVTDPNATANQINNDLHDINTWVHQWKMNFNPDTSTQSQKVIFSRKIKITTHPQLLNLFSTIIQYMFLDFKLNFQEQFENMLIKVNKTIVLLRKLRKYSS